MVRPAGVESCGQYRIKRAESTPTPIYNAETEDEINAAWVQTIEQCLDQVRLNLGYLCSAYPLIPAQAFYAALTWPPLRLGLTLCVFTLIILFISSNVHIGDVRVVPQLLGSEM